MRISYLLLFVLITFSSYTQTRYIDDIFENEEVITKIYAKKDGEKLMADIYLPKGDKLSQRPAIIFMHGGGFAGGSPKNEGEVEFAKMAARKGYVAVQISYRLTRKNQSFGCDYNASGKIKTFKEAAADYLDAVSYMREHSKEFKIDTSKIIAGGSSAGAEAVLNAVYNHQLLFPGLKEKPHFAAVFSLAGAILDKRYINENNVVPAILFHGTADQLVPYDTAPHHFCHSEDPGYLILDGSKTIAGKLKELNSPYLLYTFKGAGHEISGMPFEQLPQVFNFLKDVILDQKMIQSEIIN
ncbi:alpha/beta hydrolase fold domain-containing protein [Zunongwangia sp. F363]|uniref:Alpha/beta hydrolase fold domain-containing protein n=1 Tax=Autumnicola tepida TaxID=3075595 RepID=A0ABU3C5D7_9FLAO|nr:alpha/beta hydrolase fold domain-containing protein [Zunongwangia sp. F363]MDT0641555.1 alpha/beta hydrolase fold domain-containing protein [Zunongwangia sp. F363]